jgi:hypothetical protein
LREALTAQRNAAGKTFCAFAILRRAEGRWFPNPWQTPSSHALLLPVR